MATRLGIVARQHRQRAGLKLIDIATEAGVGQTTVHDFERGRGWRRETDELVDAYARLCETTPQALWIAAVHAREEG